MEYLTARMVLALLAGLAAVKAGAQDEARQRAPNIAVEVREVLVPVVVTDSKGRPAHNLKRSDFQVSEDGVPQEIVGFATGLIPVTQGGITNHVRPGGSGSSAVRRAFLICIDTLHSSFTSFSRVRAAIVKGLHEEQDAGAQYALMTLGRGLTVVKDSTADASAIATAIGSKEFTKTIQTSEAASTAIEIQDFTALMRNYCGLCACESAATSDQPGCAFIKARVKAFLLSFEERTYMLNHEFLLRLNELVKASASIPASRTIIFISDGFNRFPGRELYAIVEGFAPQDHTFAFPSRDTEPDLESIFKLATRYDVKFYTLDSRGVYSSAFSSGGTYDASTPFSASTQGNVDWGAASLARENSDAMAQLARETGGRFFENNNDLAKGVARALSDTREYYVLAYVSKNETLDGHFRAIKVEVNGGDKYRVNAKAGYWAAEK